MGEDRKAWVWVTKKEYYLDENGRDTETLDPASGYGSDGSWWTCHVDTKPGDLVVLYRTAPKSDIAYLLRASSDAKLLGSRPGDGVVTLQALDGLVERALAEETTEGRAPFVRQEVERLEHAETEATAVGAAMRRYGWRIADLEAVRPAHEQRELELGERERKEGLDAVQAEWDEWSEASEELSRLESYAKSLASGGPDPVIAARENLAWEVFSALDMPEETILETESEFRGRHVCQWEPLYKFERPIPLGVLRSDGWLTENWNALRAGFQGTQFRFEDGVWDRFLDVATAYGNPDLPDIAREAIAPEEISRVASEHQVRDALAQRPDALGLGAATLYTDPMDPSRTGVEYMCPDVGFIDLLLVDENGDFIVVELKTHRAGQKVIGQIAKYLGWVGRNLARGRGVRGVVVSDGYDAKYEAAASVLDLTQVELSEVKKRLGLR